MSNTNKTPKLTVGGYRSISLRIHSQANADTVDVPKTDVKDTTVAETPKHLLLKIIRRKTSSDAKRKL